MYRDLATWWWHTCDGGFTRSCKVCDRLAWCNSGNRRACSQLSEHCTQSCRGGSLKMVLIAIESSQNVNALAFFHLEIQYCCSHKLSFTCAHCTRMLSTSPKVLRVVYTGSLQLLVVPLGRGTFHVASVLAAVCLLRSIIETWVSSAEKQIKKTWVYLDPCP